MIYHHQAPASWSGYQSQASPLCANSFTFFNYHLLQDAINHTYDITLDSRRPESALSYSEICCGYPSGYNLFIPRSVVETWPRIPIMLKDAEENEEIIFVKTYFAISFNRCCVRNDLHSVNWVWTSPLSDFPLDLSVELHLCGILICSTFYSKERISTHERSMERRRASAPFCIDFACALVAPC